MESATLPNIVISYLRTECSSGFMSVISSFQCMPYRPATSYLHDKNSFRFTVPIAQVALGSIGLCFMKFNKEHHLNVFYNIHDWR